MPSATKPRRAGQSHVHVASCNIEGACSNSPYIDELKANYDIIGLQETWLWKFEANHLANICPEFNYVHTAQDELDEISPDQRPRGFGGCALLYKKGIPAQKISTNSNRICGAILQLDNTSILVLSIYMPTQGSNNSYTYQEQLDLLKAILDEYSKFDVLILGDMNASISRPKPSSVDNALVTFIADNNLAHDNIVEATFNHHNMTSHSKIDFIMHKETNKLTPMNYHIAQSTCNTSSHKAIGAE